MRMSQSTITADVHSFVIANFGYGMDASNLQGDTSFLDSGLLDSTGILELIFFLEENYKVVIEDEEMLPTNLDSLTAIDRLISRKLTERAEAEA